MRLIGTIVVVAVVVAAAYLLLGKADDLDTRTCTFVDAHQVDDVCDVDDVAGVVKATTPASSKKTNPSLIVADPNGDVRVFLKREYWSDYVVGATYP